MINLRPPLVLGTAEFNPQGYGGKKCPDEKDIVRILNLAWESGIRTIDMADSYNCTNLLRKYASQFDWLRKTRILSECDNIFSYYHYQPLEPNHGIKYASIYDSAQLKGLKEVIIPLSIYNTEFVQCSIPFYARSVFDRGRLLEIGYTVKDCLDFVKRHDPLGIIIGVNTVKELEEVLKSYA